MILYCIYTVTWGPVLRESVELSSRVEMATARMMLTAVPWRQMACERERQERVQMRGGVRITSA